MPDNVLHRDVLQDMQKSFLRRTTFASAQTLYVCACFWQVLDREEDWWKCIERLVDEHTRKGDSVLVFFKNETELRKYPGGLPKAYMFFLHFFFIMHALKFPFKVKHFAHFVWSFSCRLAEHGVPHRAN